MLTDTEKSTLKKELLDLQHQATTQKDNTNPKESMQEASGELSMYDNHPADMGTALYERERDLTLHEHAESTLAKVEIALLAIENGTYGKCESCNIDIPFERLKIVPYSTFCIDHAKEVEQSVQDDITMNEVENPFERTMDPSAIDYENSFQEVAEFGTSDSRSDSPPNEESTLDKSSVDKIIVVNIIDESDDTNIWL